MKFTLSWLARYLAINPSVSAEQIDSSLTSIGLEVESITPIREDLKGFIVACVLECEKHPDADRLSICKVDIGTEILQVICGAPNVRSGIKVIFAPVGSIIPNGQFEIKKSKIRGIDSCGMLCSANELLLGTDSEGIVELPSTAPIGEQYRNWAELNDTILDISITPNRGDCASVLGIARDLSATGIGTFKTPEFKQFKSTPNVNVKINDITDVTAFSMHKFSNLNQIAQAPVLKTYNKVYGTSEIPLVDIGNFVMYDIGQPTHIYDFDKIDGEISVRYSTSGEEFIPITTKTSIKLPSDLLIIADQSKILAVAGVMGDLRSSITNKTKNILIESAVFSPASVIKSSRSLNLKSESSYRFERGIDTKIHMDAANLISNLADIKPDGHFLFTKNEENRVVQFTFSNFEKRIGFAISGDVACNILLNLGFKFKSKTMEYLTLEIPSWRHDISIEDDISEEIIRILGYDKIPQAPLSYHRNTDLNITSDETKIRKILSVSANEVISYSFFKPSDFGIFTSGFEKISVINPITTELSVMRDSIIPSLLANIAASEARNLFDSSLFEIGNIFNGTNHIKTLCIVQSGSHTNPSHFHEQRELDIFDIKLQVLYVLDKVYGISESRITFASIPECAAYHPKQSFEIKIDDSKVGILSQIHPLLLAKFKISKRVFACEVNLEAIKKHQTEKQKSHYSTTQLLDIKREISILVHQNIQYIQILNTIKSLEITNISDISVLDVFSDEERIGKDLKSISLEFTITQSDKTLTKPELDDIINKIVNALSQKCGAILRDGLAAK